MGDELEFVFNFTNKVTGEQQIHKLLTTTNELARGYQIATANLQGLNNQQRQYIALAMQSASAAARMGKTVSGGSVNANFGPGSQNRPAGFKTSTSSLSPGAQAARQYNQDRMLAAQMQAERIRQEKAQAVQAARAAQTTQRRSGALMTTAGFGGMLLAHQASRILDPISFMGSIAPNISKITQGIGSLFGTMLGQVFSELGGAVGTAVESVIGAILTAFQTGLKAVTGFLSGIFLSFIGAGLTGGFGIAIGVITGLFNGLIAIVGGIFEIITGIVKSAMSIIASVISAGLMIVKSLFTSIGSVITGFWNGFWEGLKNTAQVVWDIIQSLTKEGLNQLSTGFKDLVESERLAAKAYIQVTDVGENKTRSFAAGVDALKDSMNGMRVAFGSDMASTANATYKVLSGGYRDAAEAMKVLNAAQNLNLIGQGDLVTTTDSLRGVMQAYKISTDDAGKTAATMNAITKLGAFELDEFSAKMGNVINTAANVKMSLQEVGAVISFASKTGLNTSKSTIGLARTLEALINPSKKARTALASIGYDADKFSKTGRISLEDLIKVASKLKTTDFQNVFGTMQSRRLMYAIANDAGALRKELTDINSVEKEFSADVEKMKGTWFFLWKTIKETGAVIRENLVVPFQKELYPVFTAISAALANMFGKVDFKGVFSGLAKSLGPLFKEVGGYVVYIINSLSEFLQGGGLNKIFSSDTFKEIVDCFVQIFRIVVNIPAALNQALSIFTGIDSIGKGLFDGVIMPVLRFISDPGTYVSMIIGFEKAIAYTKAIWGLLKIIFSKEGFGAAASAFLTLMFDAVESIGFYLKNVFLEVFRIVSLVIESTIGPALKVVAYNFVSIITEGIGRALKGIADSASASLAAIYDKADVKLAKSMAYDAEMKKNPLGYAVWTKNPQERMDAKVGSTYMDFMPQAKGRGSLGYMDALDIPKIKTLESIISMFGGLGLDTLKGANTYSDKARGTDISAEEKAAAIELKKAIADFPKFMAGLNEVSKGHFSGDWNKFAGAAGGGLGVDVLANLTKDLANIESGTNKDQLMAELVKCYPVLIDAIKQNTDSQKSGGMRSIMRDVSMSNIYGKVGKSGMYIPGMVDRMQEEHPGATLGSVSPYRSLSGDARARLRFDIPSSVSDPMQQATEANGAAGAAATQKGVSVTDETVAKNTTSMMDHLKGIREDNRAFYRGVLNRKSKSSAPILAGRDFGNDEGEEGAWDGN